MSNSNYQVPETFICSYYYQFNFTYKDKINILKVLKILYILLQFLIFNKKLIYYIFSITLHVFIKKLFHPLLSEFPAFRILQHLQ